jgi:hypothetical protein
MMRSALPPEIVSGCPQLDLAWRTHAQTIVDRPGILIPDTDDDLTCHAFLGHSLDMQGFRAAEFAGVDALTRRAPGFISLRDRGIGVRELASLWWISAIEDHLRHSTRGRRLDATLDMLRAAGGATGESLAEALARFPYRKRHSTVRALLQNSAVLESHGFSSRNWLRERCAELGAVEFPPGDFREPVAAGAGVTLEEALRSRIEATFHCVGPSLAAYMICDWQLWLWYEGRTAVFATYKQDSFHEGFVKRYGQGVIPADQRAFVAWWFAMYPDMPPRLVNACIWLATENKTI